VVVMVWEPSTGMELVSRGSMGGVVVVVVVGVVESAL